VLPSNGSHFRPVTSPRAGRHTLIFKRPRSAPLAPAARTGGSRNQDGQDRPVHPGIPALRKQTTHVCKIWLLSQRHHGRTYDGIPRPPSACLLGRSRLLSPLSSPTSGRLLILCKAPRQDYESPLLTLSAVQSYKSAMVPILHCLHPHALEITKG
jgi:hypothetical protein